jgi:6-phosphogluconolactonase
VEEPRLVIKTEVFNPESFEEGAARRILAAMPEQGVVVLTGGTTAARLYPLIAASDRDLSGIEILFSDERCVPPDDLASNYLMARRLLLESSQITKVHRMRGELPANEGARRYHDEIAGFVEEGIDLIILGMGADAHIGANFPGSPSLADVAFCSPVKRPDGLDGLTLTPPALMSGSRVVVFATGEAKADAVGRVVHGSEPIEACPARLLAGHPNVTMLLDAPAAAHL